MDDGPPEDPIAPVAPVVPLSSRAISTAALAFRGYNVENLGRTPELLRDPRYRTIFESELSKASTHAARHLGRDVDLLAYVEAGREPTLEEYGEAVALIIAASIAQLRCLNEVHDIDWRPSRVSLGYSLGEISALVASGTLELGEAMLAPLRLADDCVDLAHGVELAVMFHRKLQLDPRHVQRAMLETNLEGRGVMGVSAVLSPNSLLVLGQGDTLSRFYERMRGYCDERLHLRRNPHHWPPLHTPIVWQRNIPSRAAQLMLSMRGGMTAPTPPVLSLVTGATSYTEGNVRDILYRWIDQPQSLWAGVCAMLGMGVRTVIHVGPQPNIIPATLKRLSDNVTAQLKGNLGMRALAGLARRSWLQALLPQQASLLRAPQLKQIVLEDWLLRDA
ncbi:MAG: hypothetical protein KDB14_04270 [Planctomycetales bacterium]|nr:hypothetical protein [Planctomycetales bacterium]